MRADARPRLIGRHVLAMCSSRGDALPAQSPEDADGVVPTAPRRRRRRIPVVAGPRDDVAFFNYTDYERNALRMAAAAAASESGGPVERLSIRRRNPHREPGRRRRRRRSYVRWRPLASHALHSGRANPAGHRRLRAPRLRARQHRDRPATRVSVPHLASRRMRCPRSIDDLLRMRGAAGSRAIPIGCDVARAGRAARLGRRNGTPASRPFGAPMAGGGWRRHARAPAVPVVRETNDGRHVVGPRRVHTCRAAPSSESPRRAGNG